MSLATVFRDRRRRHRRATRRPTITEQKKQEGNDRQNKGHRKIRDGTEEDPAITRARVMNSNKVRRHHGHRHFLELQYAQTIRLNFNGMIWPARVSCDSAEVLISAG